MASLHSPTTRDGTDGVLIAAGGLIPRLARPALVLAMLTTLAIWVLRENFGGILIGTGTDPPTGPLLILLAAAYWPARREASNMTSLPSRMARAAQA
jgi:hypothetical protein